MTRPLQSLVASGTKLWLDSVDPAEVKTNRAWGATGATSNPIIVADLIKTGQFDADLRRLLGEGLQDEEIAWRLGWISAADLRRLAEPLAASGYGQYLLQVLDERIL